MLAPDVYLKTLIGTAEIPSLSGTQFVGFPGAEPQAQTQRIREVITSFDGALYAEADFKFGKFTGDARCSWQQRVSEWSSAQRRRPSAVGSV